MPVYEYQGQYYDLSETDPAAAKRKILAHLGKSEAQPEGGFFPAMRAGFEGLKGSAAALAGRTGLMDEAEAQAAYEAAQKRQAEIFKPTEEGWTEAPFQKFKETLGGSIPYMAAPLAAAGAAATLPVSGPTALAVGLGATGLTSAAQFTATNLSRQMDEGKKLADTDLGAAALAALPQAALDTLSLRLLPGVGRLLGDAGIKVTKETAKEVSEQILKKAAIDYTAATGRAMGVEGLTEAAQQSLERLQAGLSLTDEAARSEYLESLIGGAVLGGTIAPVGRFVERGRAEREVKGIEREAAAETRAATRAAEEAEKKTPEYLETKYDEYQTLLTQKNALDAQLNKGTLTQEDKDANALVNKQLKDLKKPLEDARQAYLTAGGPQAMAKLREAQRVAGMTPLEYQMAQAGVDLREPPKEERVFTGEEEIPPAIAPEVQYAQQQMALAQQQDLGTFEAADFAQYLMQDPAMAQRLVETKTAIPGVSKRESDAILGGIKLQFQERAKQERAATQAELQQRQADLAAQQQIEPVDPLELWKASVEQTEEQATEELLRPNFETGLTTGAPPTVKTPEGIRPIQNPDLLLRRIDDLVTTRDQAAKDVDTAFGAGNKELGVKKAQEREAAQTALNNLEQTDGPGRAIVALRKAQDTALMDAAQLIDDLKAGRTLGGPEAATASSTPQTLINQINRQRDAYITAAVQEAATTRRLYARGLTQEEATQTAKQMRDVFNEWVTRSMAQPRATVEQERVVTPAQMRGTEVVKGAETERFDPRPLEERRFGAYRAATEVLQEQLRGLATGMKQAPRQFRREEPLLKMQFPETEAAKVAEARGETAQTLEGELRRRRDYVSTQIEQAFQTRRVPGIAQTLLTRAQDFIPQAPRSFLDAAENLTGRILRGQNIERSDLVTMRDELRAASARPGEAEVVGERVGQRELFPAEERRALAPKTVGVNLRSEPVQTGALGLIREKPAAFETVRGKEAAKAARATAATERSEQLTQSIRTELDRIDAERRAELEARVDARRDSLQSAWQSAVKKAKTLVVKARRAAAKDKVQALRNEINAIYKGGIEGLNKETLDRFLAARDSLAEIAAKVNDAVEAVEFLPIAKADAWVEFERGALEQAEKALAETRTPQTVSAAQQQNAALQRAEQARLQSLKGEEKTAEAARIRAAQTGLGLPGQRRVEGRVERIEPEQTAQAKRAEAEEQQQQARKEASERIAAKQAEREALEQQVLDLGTQVAEREAAQKRARTPESKAKIQTEIDALNKEATLAQGQLAALGEAKPRKTGPATVATGTALARQRPMRTGSGANIVAEELRAQSEAQRKAAAKEEKQIEKALRPKPAKVVPIGKTPKRQKGEVISEAAEEESNLSEIEVFNDRGQDTFFSRGPTASPSTTSTLRTELKPHFPDLGRVQIYDSVDALIEANPQYEGKIPSDARGFVDTAGNKAFLIAENINQGQALSVLLHEVGAHIGLKNLLGDAQYNAFVNAVKGWEKRDDASPESRVARAARAKVEAAETKASQVNDELLAYAIEEAVNAGVTPSTKSPLGQWLGRIVQRLETALRSFFGMQSKDMSLRDIVNAAYGAAKVEMAPATRPVAKPEVAAEPGELLFSRATYSPEFSAVGQAADSIMGSRPSVFQRLKANLSGQGFRANFVDKLSPVETALRQAAKEGNLEDYKATQAMYYLRMYDQRNHFTSMAITDGAPVIRELDRKGGGKEFIIESEPGANIQQIVKILGRKDVVKAAGSADAANRLFTLYDAAKRAERVGFDKLNLKDPKITEESLREVRAKVDGNAVLKDAFKDARDTYNQYNRNLLEFVRDTGALSKGLVDELLRYGDYIPFYRANAKGEVELVLGDELSPVRIANLSSSPHLKELIGGDTPILNFLDSSVQNTSMLLDMALKNVAQKNLAWEMAEAGLGKNLPVTYEKGGKTKRRPVPEGALQYKLKGEDWFFVPDESALETLGVDAGLMMKGLEGIPTMFPTLMKFLGAPTRLLRRMVVASPPYMVRQLFRDTMSAALTSGADAVPVLSALKQIGRKGALDRRGIVGGQVFTGMPEDMATLLQKVQSGKPGWTMALAKLEAVSMEVDAATRRSQYESYINQGLSEMEATFMALESMNFSKRGLSASVHMASQLIPFFNAQIQGLDVLYKSLTGKMPMNEQLDIKRKLYTRGMLIFAGSIAYALAMQDDEAYKNARPDEKYGNWFIRIPGVEEPVRVPIPFELGYIFKALPEAMVNIAMAPDGLKEAQEAFSRIALNTIPGGSSYGLPQAVKPAIEVGLGRSFFTGRDIESSKEQMLEPFARFRDSTTDAAKWLGEMFNISPVKLEYLVRGYTGGLGMAMLAALNPAFPDVTAPGALKRMSEYPLVGGFFQPNDAGGIIDATYKRVQEIQQVQATYKDMLQRQGPEAARKYADENAAALTGAAVAGQFRQVMGDITAQEREVRAARTLTPEKKREILDRLRQTKIRIATSVRSSLDRTTRPGVPA